MLNGDGGLCGSEEPLESEDDLPPAVCGSFGAPVCTSNSSEFCFHDPSCLTEEPRKHGLGCGAGGHLQCRFCGFAGYEDALVWASFGIELAVKYFFRVLFLGSDHELLEILCDDETHTWRKDLLDVGCLI